MSINRHIASNFIGQFWVAAMQLAFVPVYLHFLGQEAFGLIGLFVVLQNLLVLFDFGMTQLINREMARYKQGVISTKEIRHLLRSMELVGVLVSTSVILIGFLIANWLAESWLKVQNLSLEQIETGVFLISVYGALRFLESIYKGALMGLQKHESLNALQAGFATIRGFSSWLVIAFVAPDITYFFMCQCFVSVLLVLSMVRATYKSLLPDTEKTKMSISYFLGHYRFASGMIATTFFSLILTQADKLFLSKTIDLSEFGDFMLSHTCASAIMLMVVPLSQSYYPHLTRLYEARDHQKLASEYHKACQLLTVALVPAALMLIFYAQPLVEIWTQNKDLSFKVQNWVSWLSIGNLCLGLMNMPYMLQLAYGRSAFAAKVNACIVLVQLPSLFLLIGYYGADGAAVVWIFVTSLYVVAVVPIMHRSILPGHLSSWYVNDLVKPSVGPFLIAIAASFFMPISTSRWLVFLQLLSIYVLMAVVAAVSSKEVRGMLFAKWKYSTSAE
jgi:O-antigen/teichoic acid export membrane protein